MVLNNDDRIRNFYNNIIKFDRSDNLCIWKSIHNNKKNILKKNDIISELHKFGKSKISEGVNIHDYIYDYTNNPEIIQAHEKYHRKKLLELTNISLDSLLVSKSFNILGESLDHDDNFIIPTTAYRLGYYAYQAIKSLDKNKRNIILEIGGGFGLTGLIFKRNMHNSCYIIVDIPTTAILSAYFLINSDLKVFLYGEQNNEKFKMEDLVQEYDIIIIPPFIITKFKDNFIDIVINTASFVEMGAAWVDFYIKNISRISKRMYDDNHFAHSEGRTALDNCCKKYLTNFTIVYKQTTPINFLYPLILKGEKPRPFQEVLRIKNGF